MGRCFALPIKQTTFNALAQRYKIEVLCQRGFPSMAFQMNDTSLDSSKNATTSALSLNFELGVWVWRVQLTIPIPKFSLDGLLL